MLTLFKTSLPCAFAAWRDNFLFSSALGASAGWGTCLDLPQVLSCWRWSLRNLNHDAEQRITFCQAYV